MPGVISSPNSPEPENIDPREFPIDTLPPILRETASSIQQVTGVPMEMIGPCILASASACLGQGIEVHSSPGMVTAANLFVMLVKPSGGGGSIAYHYATDPIKRYQTESIRKFEEEEKPKLERARSTLQSDQAQILNAHKSARKKGNEEELKDAKEELDNLQIQLKAIETQLAYPLIYVTDVTPERLASIMAARQETLAHFDPDGADSVAGILGVRYGNGSHAADSLHLKSFSRESVAISRQGTGKGGETNAFLRSPCLTALFVITPDTAKKLFVNERMLRGGLLARFLVASASTRPIYWSKDKKAIPPDVKQRYEKASFSLINNYRNRELGELEPIKMEPSAWNLFAENHKVFCDQFDEDFSAFESRHTEVAMRIALLIHAWKHIEFREGKPPLVSGHKIALEVDTAMSALRLMQWFVTHQNEMLATYKEATSASKLERTIQFCSRRNDWLLSARCLISAKIVANAKEAERLFADWETQRKVIREHEEPEGRVNGRRRGPRYHLLEDRL